MQEFYFVELVNLKNRRVFADVTNRVMYVTLRFFLLSYVFCYFVISRKVKQKEKGHRKMKKNGKRVLFLGSMLIYTITDWLGLVPLFICMIFGGIGFVQFVKRRSLFKVDYDIIFLGVYYIIVIFGYLIFEMIPINYRPILIEGFMEASYPSSTTLLVLSVMPTLIEQVNRRLEKDVIKKIISILTIFFSTFMVLGRLVSGVHWFTDIVGSVFLSTGLFCIYKAIILLWYKGKN